jgi:hypothetical protein
MIGGNQPPLNLKIFTNVIRRMLIAVNKIKEVSEF